MKEWNIIIAAIKESKLHLMYHYSDGWAYITDRNGKRHRLNDKMSLSEANKIIENVKQINSKPRI